MSPQTILKINIAILALVLLATLINFLTKNTNKSVTVTTRYIALGAALMTIYAPYLNGAWTEEHKHFIWFLWSFGFASIDLTIVILILKKHDKLLIDLDTNCKPALYGYAALAVLQIANYIDFVVLETKYLSTLYEFAIPSLNFAIHISLLTLSVRKGKKKEVLQ